MNKDIFTVTENHLKLIKRMNISYNSHCEFGAPEINPKRPYGNSCVYFDIGEILGIKPEVIDDWNEGEFSESQEAYMDKVHKETQIALQIAVYTQKFQIGKYESDQYRDNWRKAI